MTNENRLKITVLGEVYPCAGGIAHFNSELCNHLSKETVIQVIGYTKQVASIINPTTKRIDCYSRNFLNIKPELLFDPLNPFTAVRSAKAISRFNPDVLIFHWYEPYFAIALSILFRLIKKSNCKIVSICHEVLPHKKQFIDKQLTKLVLGNVDLFLVLADSEIKRLDEIKPGAHIKKIFHPIYDIFYRPVNKNVARKELNLKGNTILFFGFIKEYKGLNCLLAAMPYILREVDVTLLIVGEFWDDKRKYVEQIKRLKLEGHIKLVDRYVNNQEVATYFSAADALVTPYLAAANSGVINIAYAFDVPVITSRVGELGKIVKDGKTGYVVEPGRINELADAIIKFYKNDKKHRFKNEIRRFKRDYSWLKLTKKIINLLK